MLYYFLVILLFIPLWIIYPVRVVGVKNLPKKGRVIFAPNHQTLNDPIIIVSKIFRRRFRFMAKAPLFEKKLNAWFLRKMGAFPVNNTSTTDLKAVKQTLQFLKEDKAVCIFPEGSRYRPSESNDIKHGVAMFALKTNSPIVPAYFIKKTNAFVPNTLVVGKPIELHNMEEFKDKKIDKELLDAASKVIRNAIVQIKKDYLNRKNKKSKNQKVK